MPSNSQRERDVTKEEKEERCNMLAWKVEGEVHEPKKAGNLQKPEKGNRVSPGAFNRNTVLPTP